jgi:hypothetical protein
MEYYRVGRNEYALGCLPRKVDVGEVVKCLADVLPIIPKAQWKPVSAVHLVPSVLNQGSHGACVGFGCTQGVKVLRRGMILPDADLSAWDLYRRICGGRDAGANISDGLVALRDEGVATLTTCPSFTLSRSKSVEWKADAERHKIEEWFDCPTREAIATALQKGFVVPFGVPVTSSWEPDSDGWINPRGGTRGGHCILGLGFAEKNGKWGIPFVNSWDDDWGIKGFAIYPLDLIDNEYADAWAGRTATYSTG